MSLGPRDNLSQSYPAVAASVPLARRELAGFAGTVGATGEELDEIRLAVSEALTNAVMHAYRGRAGQMYVSAALAAGELWILIADDGCGLQAGSDTPGLGVGLALISEISDDFTIVNRSSGGTEVRMRFSLESVALPGDAQFGASSASAAVPASPSFSTIV